MTEPDELEGVAELVRSRRRSLRLTQADLADLAGCSERFVRSVEAGKTTVRIDKLLDVLKALGLQLTAQLRPTP